MPTSLKYLLAAIASGLLFWLGWPPHQGFAALVLLLAFTPLLWIEEQLSRKDAANSRWKVLGYSYLTFLLFNGLTTWWVCNASLAGGLFAIIANAFFMAVVMLLFHISKQQLGKGLGYFSLLLYWLAFEFLHLRWELTWPWLTLGNGFAGVPQLIQWYSITGALGGSLWQLSVNILVFRALQSAYDLQQKAQQNPDDQDLPLYRRYKLRFSIGKVLVLVLLPIGFSLVQWYTYEEQGDRSLEIVVVQPNIDPYRQKFSGQDQFIPYIQQVQRLLDLSDSLCTPKTALLAWPETSIPGGIDIDRIYQHTTIQQVKDWLDYLQNNQSLTLITGIEAHEWQGNKPESATARYYPKGDVYYDAFNSALQLQAGDSAYAYYHKSKLVPGVERMPYPALFRFLDGLAIDMGGITGSLGTQRNRSVFYTADSIGIAPIICYESVFGDYVTDYVQAGAGVLCIITNDGWWGNTAGYRQHLAYARLRAIETRRTIARAANTGVSGFINQRGEVIQQTPWWTATASRATVKANTNKTWYVQYGDVIGRTASLLAALMLLYTFVSIRTRSFFYRRNKF